MKSPIFIFSLPRAGSTLLQRILMGHKEITSLAEPWILLPILYANKTEGQISEYSSKTSKRAIDEFIDNLPNKEEGYYAALNTFATQLYKSCCSNNEVYFIDKTPRYYLIIPEIVKMFPNAKFIFLFRNPLHIYSSIISTWGKNRLNNIFNYDIDLNKGVNLLSQGYEMLKEKSFALRYEDFVSNPSVIMEDLFQYLELEYDKKVLVNFSKQNTKGSLGDPTGIKEYNKIDIRSINKWKETFATPYRKKIIKKYIQSIDSKVLSLQGYSKEHLLKEIDLLKTKRSIGLQDRVDFFYAKTVRHIKPNIFFGKSKKEWTKGLYLS